jgi:hypothetical protein
VLSSHCSRSAGREPRGVAGFFGPTYARVLKSSRSVAGAEYYPVPSRMGSMSFIIPAQRETCMMQDAQRNLND